MNWGKAVYPSQLQHRVDGVADKIEKEFLYLDDVTGGELYSMFVHERLVNQLLFQHLVDVPQDSGLVFRPPFPTLETKL